MYAELRHEDMGEGYYALRYIVYNDNIVGSYGVFFGPDGRTYGGTRDYHRLATPEDIRAYELRRAFDALDDEEQIRLEREGNDPDYVWNVGNCEFHGDNPAVCDGSSIVEIVIDDDKRAFAIAAMMAEVTR